MRVIVLQEDVTVVPGDCRRAGITWMPYNDHDRRGCNYLPPSVPPGGSPLIHISSVRNPDISLRALSQMNSQKCDDLNIQ